VLPAVILAALAAAIVLHLRGSRRRLLAALRAKWGVPRQNLCDLASVASGWRSRIAVTPTAGVLDDRTWADLDLDAVFTCIDRTESTLGQGALYHRLRTSPAGDRLHVFEALIARLTSDAPARERCQAALARLQDPYGYDLWRLGRPDAIQGRNWHVVFPLLTWATIALVFATIVRHELWPALIGVLVGDLVVRMMAAGEVTALGHAIRQVAPIVASGEELAFLRGPDIDDVVATIGSDARPLRRLKTIARWASNDPLMLSFRESGLALVSSHLRSAIYEYVNMLLLLDGNAVYFGAREVRAHGGRLLRLVAAIGEIDAALSVASWRRERNDWTRPHFRSPGEPARVENVRHPLLVDAVPNSIVLEAGRGVLVTGSNMSGKSTFLRTVGVTAVLAQTINTCLASRYEAPVFTVQSCIGRSDDLIAGKSYYIVEVEQVLERLHASEQTSPHLFLFDELFRGTNAVERIAAGEAVLRAFLGSDGRRRSHVVLAATHDSELVALLHGVYAPYHFGDSVGAEGLTFDYRLEEGPATTRNAIALLELRGAPDAVVSRALALAATIDRQRNAIDRAARS
jgi:hypothetical protein